MVFLPASSLCDNLPGILFHDPPYLSLLSLPQQTLSTHFAARLSAPAPTDHKLFEEGEARNRPARCAPAAVSASDVSAAQVLSEWSKETG